MLHPRSKTFGKAPLFCEANATDSRVAKIGTETYTVMGCTVPEGSPSGEYDVTFEHPEVGIAHGVSIQVLPRVEHIERSGNQLTLTGRGFADFPPIKVGTMPCPVPRWHHFEVRFLF